LKLDETHKGELDSLAGGWHARKHPIHLERMRKANYELFDDPIAAEDLRQRNEFEIRRDFRQEMIGIELMHACPARSARPGRYGEHIRVLGHRSEGRIRIFEHEFGVGVLLPDGQHSLLVWRELIHRKFLWSWNRQARGAGDPGVSGERGRDGTIRPALTVLHTALALPARIR